MLIVGAGGLAAQLFEDLPAMNLQDIVFWSETETKYSFIKEKYKVISTDEEVVDYFNNGSRSFIVCVGDVGNRIKMAEKFRNLGGELSTFIMPGSSISPHAAIGTGTMVLKDVDIEPGASIGEECLLNKQTNFGHDCIVSSFCEIGPLAMVSAGVEIGENCLVGMRSTILPKIKIGKNVIISAGSVVTKNIPDNAVVSGNPAIIRFYRKKMTVSICMITYNHEDYIAEAIESVLKQSTSFSFELIIGEDKSPDRTRNICEEYAKKYPHIIKLLPAENNLGMMKNFTRTWQACAGEYIAFIEGDDYWTDPMKLQKQIDFLETNPEYSACFHNVLMKLERDNEKREWILHKDLVKDSFETEDVLNPWFIPTLSFVFVNYPDFVLPEWFFNCKYGDLPFMLLLSLRGKFKYIDEVMGVYRLHDNGVSNLHKAYDKIILMVYIYESFNVHTGYKYREAIRKACIYEIEKHAPPKNIVNSGTTFDKQSILIRGYRKIKRVMGRGK